MKITFTSDAFDGVEWTADCRMEDGEVFIDTITATGDLSQVISDRQAAILTREVEKMHAMVDA